MKKIITCLFLNSVLVCYSQIIIGGTKGTAPTNKKAAVLIEFEAGINKGFILPSVRTLPVSPNVTPGTLLLDASVSNSTMARVRLYAPNNPNADATGWVDLSSGNVANLTKFMSSQPLSTGNNIKDELIDKTVIGSERSDADGVLVLESTTKAMILPQVLTTNDIKDPTPGMMVYITGEKKRLAVFNGSKWTYWAAQ